MKKSIALIVALMLILTACTPAGNAPETQPGTTAQANSLDAIFYGPFVFLEYNPYPGVFDIEDFDLERYCLYMYDAASETMHLISKSVFCHQLDDGRWDYVYAIGQEYIYYPRLYAATQLFRSNYTGTEQELIYESSDGSKITYVSCYEEDGHDKLLLIENSRRVILYDPTTGSKEYLMAQYYVRSVSYAPDVQRHINDYKGPILYWDGKVSEDDTWERGYVYHILTGENFNS